MISLILDVFFSILLIISENTKEFIKKKLDTVQCEQYQASTFDLIFIGQSNLVLHL